MSSGLFVISVIVSNSSINSSFQYLNATVLSFTAAMLILDDVASLLPTIPLILPSSTRTTPASSFPLLLTTTLPAIESVP